MNAREQDQLALVLAMLAKSIHHLKLADPDMAASILTECRTCGIEIHLIHVGTGGDPSLN
jgi:hypothetical protein